MSEAVRWYRLAAEQGLARAQLSLGLMYANGRAYRRTMPTAVRWYRLAAEQGNDFAQWRLGNMYNYGWGVPEDDAEAVRWYRLAAEQGNDFAQWRLGNMYATGWGVPEDDAEAVRWYRLAWRIRVSPVRISASVSRTPTAGAYRRTMPKLCAGTGSLADQGLARAQLSLGLMYANGRGLPEDDAEAATWYRKAAEGGAPAPS